LGTSNLFTSRVGSNVYDAIAAHDDGAVA